LKPRRDRRCAAPPGAALRSGAVMLWLLAALAAAAAPFVPASDEQVLERLPVAPADPVQRDLRDLRARLAREPGNLSLAVTLARRYAELGRSSGDPRYAGYAQSALAPWWGLAEPPREVRMLRATLRQRVHEFDAALADLAALIAADPRDGQARLTRATVLQVRGEFEAASHDCAALRRLASELVWAACAQSVAGATGRLREAYGSLAAALARQPQAAPEVRAWVLGELAEMAGRAGLPRDAETHFRAALELDPTDHYALGAYADFLLDAGRPAEALALLDGRLRTDALLLRHALALAALRAPGLGAEIETLRARFAASRMRGDRVHQREEARFALVLLRDPPAALRLAQENWAVQKEPPDLRILLEAARAAGDAAAVAAAREWLARSGLEDAQLARLTR
jgi:Tfp pilus assembly protein PilF